MLRTYSTRFFAPEKEEGAESEEGEEPIEGEEGAESEEGEESIEGEEGAESEEGEESTEGEEGAEPPARRETRVQKLANEARKEREARIAAEAETKALRESRSSQSSDTGEAARVRAEKLALMSPEEKERFLDREEISQLKQGQQLTQLQIADYSDRAGYDTKAAKNPVYAKHKAWVEDALIAARKNGSNPTREMLLRWKIGEDALSAKPGKKAAKAKEDAAARTESAKGKSTSARGDAGGNSGKADSNSLEAIRARIEKEERRRGYI